MKRTPVLFYGTLLTFLSLVTNPGSRDRHTFHTPLRGINIVHIYAHNFASVWASHLGLVCIRIRVFVIFVVYLIACCPFYVSNASASKQIYQTSDGRYNNVGRNSADKVSPCIMI